jgi:hypothetical protein
MVEGRFTLAFVLILAFFLADDEWGWCLVTDVAALLGEDGTVVAADLGIEVIHLNY